MEGDLEAGTASCGQVVGLIHEVTSVNKVIENLVEGAIALKQRLYTDQGHITTSRSPEYNHQIIPGKPASLSQGWIPVSDELTSYVYGLFWPRMPAL